MKKKLIVWHSLIIALVISLLSASGILLAKRSLLNEAEAHTIALTHAYKEAFTGDFSSLSVSDEDIRETIIAVDGTVLWDSSEDASKLPSHLDREEVAAALEGSPRVAIRSSESVGVQYVYYAETKLVGGTTYVIRIALRLSSLASFLSGYIPWMIVAAILALGFSVVGICFVTSRSLRPLKGIEENLAKAKNGETLSAINVLNDDELGRISRDIDEISHDLSSTIKQLKKEEEKMSVLLSNLPNPVLAIAKNREIIFINEAAKSLFFVNGNFLPETIKLSDLSVYKDENHGKTYMVFQKDASDYSLFVLNDITLQKEAEKQRKEFVDAASHELKTPLTTIKGFNDLIGMQSFDPKVKEYVSKISDASNRMLKVVQDMLSISSLEEAKVTVVNPIEIRAIAEESLKRLSVLASERNVKLSVVGEGKIRISEEDAILIIKNLVENAIIYNVLGGEVTVTLKDDYIEVKDTGIGIAPKEQERVFERFYRVDKSHSRQNGGTGLGLSIVKHAANKYRAKISLKSRLGYGTEISIRF